MKKLFSITLALALSATVFAAHIYSVRVYCETCVAFKYTTQTVIDDSWEPPGCSGHTYRDFTSRGQGRTCMLKGADVASADEITLGLDGDYFDITGTTTIHHIDKTGWREGSVVTLQFDASVTVTHNSGSPTGTEASLLLSGATDFNATVDDTLQLVYDGITFREASRTVI